MRNDPLHRFEVEHQEALGVLRRLEDAAHALERGEAPASPLGVIREALRFVSTTVREHNEAEERALFTVLGEAGLTEVFAEEHGRLRALEAALDAALNRPDAPQAAPAAAFALVDLLRDHIHREDQMLFPHAREVLGRGGLEAVADRL